MALASDILARLPPSIPDAHREALVAVVDAWSVLLGPNLVSLVLFGSVARGTATPASDVDVLIVAKGLPKALHARRAPLLAEWARIRMEQSLSHVEWNLVVKTPEEATYHSPLYLDMTEDGILFVDRDGFFQGVLDRMRVRMRELGSRRIPLPDGSWYWDLKPGFRWGEIVEI
jgi:predicted nucleotidyltransferase